MNGSSIIGKLGTVLAAVYAFLADSHTVATSPNVSIALTAVVGWLVGHHILAGSAAKTAESDALWTVRRMADVVDAAIGAGRSAAHTPAPATAPTAVTIQTAPPVPPIA